MARKQWMLAALLASAMMLSSCALLPEEDAIRTAPVIREYQSEPFEMATVERGDLVRTERVTAKYVPVRKESMSFGITGETVDMMFVKVGDSVEKGQLLGQQRVEDLEEGVARCEAEIQELQLRLAHEAAMLEIDLQRAELLHAAEGRAALQEAIQDVEEQFALAQDEIQDALSVQQLRLEDYRARLAQRQLRAPFAGTVTFVREYDEGHQSGYAEVAVTLADSTMTLFRAETKQWDAFHVGERYEVEVDKQGYTLEVVDEASLGLEPQAKEAGEKAFVYFVLTEAAPILEEGDSCYITLELERREDVLHVPSTAVMEAGDRWLVYYQNADGVKDYKEVAVGAIIDRRVEILSGLEEGEQIIAG